MAILKHQIMGPRYKCAWPFPRQHCKAFWLQVIIQNIMQIVFVWSVVSDHTFWNKLIWNDTTQQCSLFLDWTRSYLLEFLKSRQAPWILQHANILCIRMLPTNMTNGSNRFLLLSLWTWLIQGDSWEISNKNSNHWMLVYWNVISSHFIFFSGKVSEIDLCLSPIEINGQ